MRNCVTSTRTAHVKPAREPTAGKGIKLQDLPEVSLNLTSTRTAHVKPAREPTAGKGRRRIKIQDLPEDMLCEILSKLPAEEVVRTSVLSSEWRCLWTGCPKLSFRGRTLCGREDEQDTQMFIDSVNTVLRQHSGKGVEGLEVKCLFENKLVDHLNNLISFALSSRTKNLALHLLSTFMGDNNPYVLPSELFDKESASCLECLQLSFVCLKPPSQFLGFSILRDLQLDMLENTRKDLEDMLCSCCNLEWLSIVRCRLRDELTVVRPLPRLQYLRIFHCFITKIEFHAAKLSTFVYNGPCILIALHRASKLETAQVRFSEASSHQAVTTVLNGIPEVQRLTLQLAVERGKPQWMLGSPHMFSRLRHVQLLVELYCQDNDMLVCLLSFLSVAPVIEKLEVHFEDFLGVWFAHSESFRREVPSCQYKHLKSMYVSGFTAGRGQVEFVTHVAENASAIEVVTIDTAQHHIGFLCPEIKPADRRSALDVVRGPLLEKLPADAKLFLR